MSNMIARHWVNQFTRQYAIRLPDGRLYGDPAPQEDPEDYSVPSPLRDMYRTFSFMFGTPPVEKSPSPAGPRIFSDHGQAEELLDELKAKAAEVGVDNWGGAVVERLCTPFTSGDPSVEFAEAIVAWVRENGGAA